MKNRVHQFLELHKLETVPNLAGLLPHELASRYHALPVAEDGERITVAIANPDDKEAREAIHAVLGPSVFFVHADVKMIDRLLRTFWQKKDQSSLEFLYWNPKTSTSLEVKTYAERVAVLLGSHISLFETSAIGMPAFSSLFAEVERNSADIVILRGLEQSFLDWLIEEYLSDKSAKQLQTSILVVRQPRWPIENILLVLGDDSQDETAVNWTIRFASSTMSEVTILPVTLPMPIIYDQDLSMRCSIDAALTFDTKLGRKLRLSAQRLVSSGIYGVLHFRQEPPIWQIRFELFEKEYDLVIIDCGIPEMLWHSIMDEVVDPMFSWTDKPVLITQSAVD